ncbi:kinase [Thalassobacillus pellis]|uniref:kinase n=1 Tax=Thalassobacillus pellis TaxID=748008 RepID=UPI00196145FE|nr:kinase [Thalassobacillus pellis]MBM7553505.1 uridine kinase [Thalassobacillus pellis]
MNFSKLLSSINPPGENRFILGIDGLSRAGKTTFTKKLCDHLGDSTPYYAFHIDEHIVERDKRYHTGYESWYEYYYLQWDIDWLTENFFKKLKSGKELYLPFYNNKEDYHQWKNIKLPDPCLIIIEGVFLQRSVWRKYFDYVMYLDCSKDIRYSREKVNNQHDLEKLEHRYWRAENYYLTKIAPKENADIILKGD